MMPTAALAFWERANLFQKYLIPAESKWVRMLMEEADSLSQSSIPLVARLASVVAVAVATFFSLLNSASYALQIPIKILLNVVRFDPLSLGVDLAKDVASVFRSLAFVAVGVSLVIAGPFFPKELFSHFAPSHQGSRLDVLEEDNQEFLQRTIALEEEKKLLKSEIASLKDQVERLKGNRPFWKIW